MKKLNMEDVKIHNRGAIIRLLYNNPPITRLEIAETLGLTPASVSIILNEFISIGLVNAESDTTEQKRAGRKTSTISLNYTFKYILGINIRPSESIISITNLKGDMVASRKIATNGLGFDAFVSLVSQESIRLLWENNLTHKRILGAGIIVIGPVDSENGIALHAFNVFNKPVNLKEPFEKALGIPVFVESNVCAVLLSDVLMKKFDENTQNILAVKWGPGIGSAALLKGELFKGANHHSSEIGHCASTKSNLKCRCGKTGCIETVLSVDALSRVVKNIAKENLNSPAAKTMALSGEPSPENISDFIHCGDPIFDTYMDESCFELALHISNAISILNPDKIILYGEILTDESISGKVVAAVLKMNNDLDENIFAVKPKNSSYHYESASGLIVQRLLIDKLAIE